MRSLVHVSFSTLVDVCALLLWWGSGVCILVRLETLWWWTAAKGPNCGGLCHPPTDHGAVTFSFQWFEGLIMRKAQHWKSYCNAIGIDQLNDARSLCQIAMSFSIKLLLDVTMPTISMTVSPLSNSSCRLMLVFP